MDTLYEDFKCRQMGKDPVGLTREERKQASALEKSNLKEKFQEWYGIEYDKEKDAGLAEDEEISNASDDDVLLTDSESETEALSTRAKTFFDNPIFSSVKKTESGLFDKEMDMDSESDESDQEIRQMNTRGKRHVEDSDEVEVVPAAPEIIQDFSDGK